MSINYNFKVNSENYSLKIIMDNEFSNIRTELSGFPNIQHYCKYNSISDIIDKSNIKYVEKEYFNHREKKVYPLDFDDFNFRVSFQVEKHYNETYSSVQDIMNKWNTTKKIFRYVR